MRDSIESTCALLTLRRAARLASALAFSSTWNATLEFSVLSTCSGPLEIYLPILLLVPSMRSFFSFMKPLAVPLKRADSCRKPGHRSGCWKLANVLANSGLALKRDGTVSSTTKRYN